MYKLPHSTAKSILSSKWSNMPRIPVGAKHRIILGEPTVGKTHASKECGVYDEDTMWKRWCRKNGIHGWDVVDDPKVRAQYRADVIDELAYQLGKSDVAIWEERLALELSIVTGAPVYPVVIATGQEYAERQLSRYLKGEKPGMPEDRRIQRHLELEHDRRVSQWIKRFGFGIALNQGEYLTDVYQEGRLRSPTMIWIHSYKGVTPDHAYRIHLFIGNHDKNYYIAVNSYDRYPGTATSFNPTTRQTSVCVGSWLKRSHISLLAPCEVYGYKPDFNEVGTARRAIMTHSAEEDTSDL